VADESSILVNFGRPMPVFPLDTAALLPQQVIPLHIFEPRYVQMVEHALDSTGQFAMAVFQGRRWKQEYHGRPPMRAAVCVGQVLEHQRLPQNKYNVLLQGVCRARILREIPPGSEHLYREAMLEPVGIDEAAETKLYGVRERLTELLSEAPLSRLVNAEEIVKRIHDEDIPTAVILELVSFALPTHREVRYRLLAEGDAGERAELIESELVGLQHLIRQAGAQHPERWPKGLSWN
jgi:Lon protease-like protein